MLNVHKICLTGDIALRLWLWLLWCPLVCTVRPGPISNVFGPSGALSGPALGTPFFQLISQSANGAITSLPVWGVLPHPKKPKFPEQTPTLVQWPKYEKIRDLLVSPVGIGTRLLRTSM